MAYELSSLGYDYDALEPAIDTHTMKLHHDQHHRGYVDQLNKAIAHYPQLHNRTIEDLLIGIHEVPEEIRTTVRNCGGGHANHELFWKTIGPPSSVRPHGGLAESITECFGSVDKLQEQMTAAALKVFGSGWVFLAIDPGTGKLEIMSLPNQDVVLYYGKSALLACDVWEHSYYLKYENRRPEYLKAFWDVVQWEATGVRFDNVLKRSLSATN